MADIRLQRMAHVLMHYSLRGSLQAHILFDEKIGGTIHLALGASYPETGSVNRSSLHWDMVFDLRSGGEVRVDGELFCKDGTFVV